VPMHPKRLLSLPNPPDAIFASTSDFSALGVLEVATAMNIKVPSELGICGYSNEDFTEITSPSITTIDQFSVYMGKTIANLILSRKLRIQMLLLSQKPSA
jgi:LacI family repressor for deo operon, udp, cdd, tsx, nupC, and nupG